MRYTPEVSLDEYGVSLQNGFLPHSPPLKTMENPYYWPWEHIVSDLPDHIRFRTIRQAVETLPVLSTSKLQGEPEWRRAYLLLAYLTHAYIWGGEKPKDVLPPAISSPFLEVSSHLELPPCATYAALNLWNYATSDPNADLTDPDLLSVTASFTGTKDEEWFLMISVALEAKGAQLIPLMLDTIHAVSIDDAQLACDSLLALSEGLKELRTLLERMYEKNRPSVFYHQLRPLLAGSKNMASAGLPNGVFYDIGDGQGQWHQYSGGSNAQSSLIQTFDIFLGVEHIATGGMKTNDAVQPRAKNGFMQEMRNYMPGPHRRFLEMLTRVSNVRAYALSHKANSPIRDAYNAAVMSLGVFRDSHIQIVTRYIIMAAKAKPPTNESTQVNLATSTTTHMRDKNEKLTGGIHGTGGTDLIPFLKQTRDTTKATASYD
ncbi:indoleamine 2,3-dioxygenase family protein [Aspergillus oryzae 100-8]|uniref:Indoleamine 2,3-dioxygenase n=1 Tax=Aspergillus oryzae (strain 3.042) TaxID=1160506 RepID=I8AE88_ASPO3|nr:indoleamine 2,3-dioxygenase family protein [Aspergillus oryzae 3.042]KDE78118.1 indoleamine 2,3-dioxygenase family protein [Aspergillus oryzae 100-8]|eukprot:EIT83614.1 indoleamine 2,3-dioxygenase family protein [Aspergillus oryzae 3.042]